MSKDPVFVTMAELAEILDVNKVTIREWILKGYIPKYTFIKVGRTFRFDRDQTIEALKKSNADEPDAPQQLELDFGPEENM